MVLEKRIGLAQLLALEAIKNGAEYAFERPADAVSGIVADEFRRTSIDGDNPHPIVHDNRRGRHRVEETLRTDSVKGIGSGLRQSTRFQIARCVIRRHRPPSNRSPSPGQTPCMGASAYPIKG